VADPTEQADNVICDWSNYVVRNRWESECSGGGWIRFAIKPEADKTIQVVPDETLSISS